MELSALISFLSIVAFGSYTQTVTGFGLGLTVMGTVTLFSLAPIEFSSVVVSILALVNSMGALYRHHNTVDRRILVTTVAGLLPGVILGVYLLGLFSTHAIQTLRTLLGIFIIVSGLLLMYKPHPKTKVDSRANFFALGVTGGIFGGMFSTAGPPIVYQLYRQPITVAVIRTTLLSIFIAANALRIIFVGIKGDITWQVIHLSLYSIPVVVVFTLLGRKFRPPLSDITMRRIAFTLLVLIGALLLIPRHMHIGS